MTKSLPERRLSRAELQTAPPGLFPGRPQLKGLYASVEALNPDTHAGELWDATQAGVDPDRIWEYLGYGPFPSPEAFRSWLRGCSAVADPIFFAIRDSPEGKAAGMASYLNIRPTDGVIEIGHIWLSPSLQQTRAATEALYLLIRHAMDDLGYRRMEWKCNALNEASCGAAKRLGFAYEGTFYQATIAKGRNRDTSWFSILDSEWPAIQTNFATWLSPENFDTDGHQIQSLGELNRSLRVGA